jgi:hypothetical protein
VSRAVLKAVESPLDGPREELRLAIIEVEQAETAAKKAQAAVDLASAHDRAMESAHFTATSALETARAPRRTLAEKLAGVRGEEEQWDIIEEHKAEAGRPAITLDDLKRLRAAVDAAEDDVVVARNAVEVAEARATPTASALNRAKDRRTRAVQEVVRPEIGRLMREAQLATEQLIAARAALNYVANGPLTDWYSNDRRQASIFLTRFSFPSEQGLRTEDDLTKRNAAIAQWQAFAQRIETDASAEFPSE